MQWRTIGVMTATWRGWQWIHHLKPEGDNSTGSTVHLVLIVAITAWTSSGAAVRQTRRHAIHSLTVARVALDQHGVRL